MLAQLCHSASIFAHMPRSFTFSFWNVQGLTTIRQRSDILRYTEYPDFLGLTECWTSKEEALALSDSFSGYNIIFNPRHSNVGTSCSTRGGTALLYKKEFAPAIQVIDRSDGDMLWIKAMENN